MRRFFEKLFAVALGLLFVEMPAFCGFNLMKQGRGVLIFNVIVVLLMVGVAVYVWMKKRAEGGEGEE